MPIVHKFNGDDFIDFLPEMAKTLECQIIDDTIYIPSHLGSGFIKSILIEANFYIRYFNCTYKTDFEFEIASTQPESAPLYKLHYNLDKTNPVVEDSDNFHSNNSNVLLYSTDFERKGTIKKDVNFKRIMILFDTAWLDANYTEAGKKMKSLIQDFTNKNKATVISESLDIRNRLILQQLANEMDSPLVTKMHVKTSCFILLNDFLNKITMRDMKDVRSDQTLHYYTIMKVEERIMKSVHSKLPNLDQLAHEFNMSLSTLKRHFRIVFGKNIYQYYQEKRMEWGKAELEKGQSNISEIATHLGFFKINNFSRAFKKQYGILPSEIKHKSSFAFK